MPMFHSHPELMFEHFTSFHDCFSLFCDSLSSASIPNIPIQYLSLSGSRWPETIEMHHALMGSTLVTIGDPILPKPQVGQPDFAPPPEAIKATAEAAVQGLTAYTAVTGLTRTDWFAEENWKTGAARMIWINRWIHVQQELWSWDRRSSSTFKSTSRPDHGCFAKFNLHSLCERSDLPKKVHSKRLLTLRLHTPQMKSWWLVEAKVLSCIISKSIQKHPKAYVDTTGFTDRFMCAHPSWSLWLWLRKVCPRMNEETSTVLQFDLL